MDETTTTTKFNIYQKITQTMIECLNKGIIPWDSGLTRNPDAKLECEKGNYRNGNTGAEYSPSNIVFVAAQLAVMGFPYKDKRFYTLKSVGKNATLKKGSKSVLVTFSKPFYVDPKDNIVSVEEYEKLSDEEKSQCKKRFALRYYKVFNHECFDWKELPKDKPVSTPPKLNVLEVLTKYGEKSGLNIDIKESWITPSYCPQTDKIEISNTGYYKSNEAWSHAIFHEAVHSTGCHKRLKRYNNNDFPSNAERCREELVADIGATFLLNDCGIKPNIENHAAYCREWAEFLQKNTDDKTVFTTAFNRAIKAKNYIENVA